jgi:hypothetical protein
VDELLAKIRADDERETASKIASREQTRVSCTPQKTPLGHFPWHTAKRICDVRCRKWRVG